MLGGLQAGWARFRQGAIPQPHVVAASLHMACGAVVFALTPALRSPRWPLGVAAVGGAAVVIGAVIWRLPWHRWSERATRWLIPEALTLVALFNVSAGDLMLYDLFYFVVWIWIGLTQPPGVALRFSPLLVGAYTVPALFVGDSGRIALSAVFFVPVCVVVGEVVALVAERLRLSERAVTRSEARYASLMRHASELIVVLDADRRIRYTNAAFERLVGASETELRECRTSDLVHPDDRDLVMAWFRAAIAGAGTSEPMEYRIANAHDEWRHVEATVINLLDDEAINGIVMTGRDISDRRAAERVLSAAAFTDSLTGLGNRAALVRDLGAIAAGRAVALLFLDLDGFKVINDSLGHTVGDELLVQIARRLEVSVPGPSLIRMGGDEFVLLVEDARGDVVNRTADAVLSAFCRPFAVGSRELRITASVGVAIGADGTTSAEELLRRADLAMYRAKRDGGSRWAAFDDELAERARRRLELEDDLRRGLTRGELFLEYQPLVDVATRRVDGVEALVRWQHPTLGRLAPDAFLDVAEDAGVLEELGAWVLDEAVAQCARWHRSGRPVTVSVNVAPVQLRMSFIGLVADVLQRHGVAGEHVCIELTEHSLLEAEVGTSLLPALRELGLSVAIDDFGTGYSSLSYLHRLPVDALKIDRSFLRPSGSGDSGLVAAIVGMAHSLGLSVVAEGVETPEHLRLLDELRCDRAQGFFFGRPMSSDEVSALLEVPADRGDVVPLRLAR